jgi:hypothetical protein
MSGKTYRFYVRLLPAISILALTMPSRTLGKIMYVDDDAPAKNQRGPLRMA